MNTLSKAIFQNPPKKFRGVPFWSLNDALRDKELRRQIKIMDEGGFGGFFLHAREGLITPYLTNNWFDRVKTCVTEAKKRGMYAWLYDEDKWPSGFAGGAVSSIGPEYRTKALLVHIYERIDWGKETLAVFEISSGRKVKRGEKEVEKENYAHFIEYVSSLGNRWFSDFSYIDTLNVNAVKEFLEKTHEKYFKLFKDEFGKTIPGIFTDEPNFISRSANYGRGAKYPSALLPWTNNFQEYFRDKNGYDIVDNLLSLIFDVGNYTKVRYDYWKTVTELFVNSYSKTIYEWCNKHGIKYTGHYLAEDTLLSQLKTIGAAMPHYEYEHIPGIDHLGRHINNNLTVKQVASVANQLGKERVLSETYGTSGQSLSFEDRKWIGDWEFVLGVNLLNHHLVLYSMRGLRKRDYPPTFSYHQPWWKYNRLIEDYFARLSYALSLGKRLTDILIIHPISSAWILYTPFNEGRVRELDEKLKWLIKELLDIKLDYELGDEIIMEKYGSVSGNKLIVGRCAYSIVIIPPSINISSSTFNLLKKFVNNGGKLIIFKQAPFLIDGERSNKIKELFEKAEIVDLSEESILKAFKDYKRPINVVDNKGKVIRDIWYHLREVKDKLIIFLVNLNRNKSYDARVLIRYKGSVEKWDPFTGTISLLNSKENKDYIEINLKFPPTGSHLIVIDKTKKPQIIRDLKYKLTETIDLRNSWNLKRLSPNSLTIDFCKVKIEDKEWSDKMYVLDAERYLRLFGLGTKFSVKYEFSSNYIPKRIYAVIEDAERYTVLVNGTKVTPSKDYWLDVHFKRIDISKFIKPGLNEIIISGKFNLLTEIESIYIIGDFTVKDNSIIEKEEEHVKIGDFTKSGYPFFAGSLSLSKEINIKKKYDKIVLRVYGLSSTVTEVRINEKLAGYIFTSPYSIDITKFLREGKNNIELILTNSLRNLLGPHHNKREEIYFVGPESFNDKVNWTNEYKFVKFGLDKVVIEEYSS